MFEQLDRLEEFLSGRAELFLERIYARYGIRGIAALGAALILLKTIAAYVFLRILLEVQ